MTPPGGIYGWCISTTPSAESARGGINQPYPDWKCYIDLFPVARFNFERRACSAPVVFFPEWFWCIGAGYLSPRPVIGRRRRLTRTSCCRIATLGNAPRAEAIRNWHLAIFIRRRNRDVGGKTTFISVSLMVGSSEKHLCSNTAATTKWAQTLQHQCHV